MSSLAPMIRAAAPMVLLSAAVAGCSRPDTAASARDSSAAAPVASSAPATTSAASPGASPGDTIVRGRVVSVTDSMLIVGTPGGDVRVAVASPVQVYDREPADLSRVTEHTFVGVTSVPEPDGSQRATEIHIFPQELRGLGEGSRPMGRPAGGSGGGGGGGNPSTMTNGTVRGTMTNGTVAASGASRMTNGAVRAQAGGTLTVEYQGGSQTIAVPAGVPVTAIAPTKAALTAGANVVVLASKQPDGTLRTSRVLLAPAARQRPSR